MNEVASHLINRLAHRVKNDLTTLRLALFNLKHALQEEQTGAAASQASDEFINVMNSTLAESIQILSDILVVTRDEQSLHKPVDVVQVLSDALIHHPQHGSFDFTPPAQSFFIRSDLKLLHLFFTYFFDLLLNCRENKEEKIVIGFHLGKENELSFKARFGCAGHWTVMSDAGDEVKNKYGIQELMVKHLINVLRLEILLHFVPDRTNDEIILKFNR